MSKYIMRLDDACPYRDIKKWDRIEALLDKYNIKPLIGIIPNCEDESLLNYEKDNDFWNRVNSWVIKEYTLALHGYNHVYGSNSGGINPVNQRSEFAGLSLEEQKVKLKKAVSIFKEHSVEVKVFFAPSHTFDLNTLKALEEETDIRIISDTIANNTYSKYGFTFVPQQSGTVRKLPFDVVTFCYHPNTMEEEDFEKLEKFLKENKNNFIEFPTEEITRNKTIYDNVLSFIYFAKRKLK